MAYCSARRLFLFRSDGIVSVFQIHSNRRGNKETFTALPCEESRFEKDIRFVAQISRGEAMSFTSNGVSSRTRSRDLTEIPSVCVSQSLEQSLISRPQRSIRDAHDESPWLQALRLRPTKAGSTWSFKATPFPEANIDWTGSAWMLSLRDGSILVGTNQKDADDRFCVFRNLVRVKEKRPYLCFPSFSRLLAGCC